MQLTTASTPVPLPVMPTTGPSDWVGVPLATLAWKSNHDAEPAFASTEGFTKLDDVDSLEGALASASRMSYERSASPMATAVLQAKDGVFYLAALGRLDGPANRAFLFPVTADRVRVESATPHVDALKAIVGGTTWVRFDVTGGEPATPTPV